MAEPAPNPNPNNDPNLPGYDPTRGAQGAGVDPTYALVLQKYAYLAPFFDHPEIGPLLRRAAQEGWTREVLQGALFQTDWWQATSATAREWALLSSSDPAEANRQRQLKRNELTLMAAREGYDISSDTIRGITELALAGQWDEQFTRSMLFAGASYSGRPPQGVAGQNMALIEARAAQYGVAMSDWRAFQYAKRMSRGGLNQEGLEVELREQAKSRYTHLANEFDRGFTLQQVLEPYTEQLSQMLERPGADFDWRDPKWQKIINFVDPRTSRRRMMSLSETSSYVKSLDQYWKTRNAHEEVATLGEAILQTFGKVSR